MPLKLHLGCGKKRFPPESGWVNIDLPTDDPKVQADVFCDVKKLPYENETVDEILAVHLIEHFYIWESPEFLREWNRVLKVGGLLKIECPSFDKIMRAFYDGKGFLKTWAGLYGDPTDPNPIMVHKWCYTFELLKQMLELSGFDDVREYQPFYHFKDRDMRVECKKREYIIGKMVIWKKQIAEEAA